MSLSQKLMNDYYGTAELDKAEKIQASIFDRYVTQFKLTAQETKDFFLYYIQLGMTRNEALDSATL